MLPNCELWDICLVHRGISEMSFLLRRSWFIFQLTETVESDIPQASYEVLIGLYFYTLELLHMQGPGLVYHYQKHPILISSDRWASKFQWLFFQNQDKTVSVLSEHSAPNNAIVGCEPPDYGIHYLLFNCDSGRTLSETINSNSLVFACGILGGQKINCSQTVLVCSCIRYTWFMKGS